MSIPIKDINAGDTVSSMVDKLNYNFDLLSLKGGGPQGLQGIQGIRGSVGDQGVQGVQGVKGTGVMHGINNPAGTANEGDVYIDESTGNIYSYENNQWNIIFNPTEISNSPFTWIPINNNHAGIVKRVDVPFILGGDTTTQENIINSQHPINSSLNIYTDSIGSNNTNIISIFASSNLSTHAFDLAVNSSNTILKTSNSYNLVIGDFGTAPKHVILDSNLKLKGYAGSGNGEYAIVTSSNNYGIVPPQSSTTKQWIVDITGNGAMYPKNSYDIGKNGKGVKDLYITPSSVIYSGSITTTSGFPKIKNTYLSSGETIMGWSKNGVSFGINSTNYNNNFLNNNTFGILVGNPSNTAFATYIKLKPQVFNTSQDNNGNSEHIIGTTLTYDSSTNDLYYDISFTNSKYYDLWNFGYISPIISVGGCDSIDGRNIRRMLTVKGQDDRCGNDILLSGGDSRCDTLKDDANDTYNNVGGNVYIAGGGAIRQTLLKNTSYGYAGDLRNLGNVIIGINPVNHKQITNSVYGSQRSLNNDEISATDPNGIDFFDVCDVAIHGNRIVIDSHANQRKYEQSIIELASATTLVFEDTDYEDIDELTFTERSYNKLGYGTPYIAEPENATLQVSALNTIYRDRPIVIEDYGDIYYNQFLSGVMCYAVCVYYNTNSSTSPVISYVTDDEFKYLVNGGGAVSVSDSNKVYRYSVLRNSAIFVVHQTWQKVGNIVNVSARCEWFAFTTKYNTSTSDPTKGHLCRITNLCEGESGTNSYSKGWSDWVSETSVIGYNKQIYNTTMFNFMYKNIDNRYAIKEVFKDNGTDSMNNQPMSVILAPYSIKNTQNTFCYGNGGIFTEIKHNPSTTIAGRKISPNTLKSHQVFIGNESMIGTSSVADNYFTNSHSLNNKVSGYITQANLVGKTFNVGNNRFTQTGASDWAESKFAQTYVADSDVNYTCVVPSMICEWRNTDVNNNGNAYTLRPVVGLYTAMNFNYSYMVGSHLTSTGAFNTFRKTQPSNTSPGIATHQSEIGTITNEATEYASAI